MKWLFVLLLLIPFVSSLGVDINYPDSVFIGETFIVEAQVLNSSGEFYDIKIDIIQNGKRISRIEGPDGFKSSMYYLKEGIQEHGEFSLIVFDGKSEGAELIVKLRDSSGEVNTFRDYEIIIDESEKNKQEGDNKEQKSEEREEKKDKKNSEYESNSDSQIAQIERDLEKTNTLEVNRSPPKTISLNPKTIKKDESLEDKKSGYGKYLFLIFSIVLLTLYIIKPNKKKNEFRY